VISRGNYRKELFLKASTVEAFERCLFEAVDRCGWKLHAYVIMSNHYHLAVETPESNLVVGMFRGEADKTGRVVNRNSGCKAYSPLVSTVYVMNAGMFTRSISGARCGKAFVGKNFYPFWASLTVWPGCAGM